MRMSSSLGSSASWSSNRWQIAAPSAAFVGPRMSAIPSHSRISCSSKRSPLRRELQPCLGRLCAQPALSREVVGLRHKPPCPGEPEVVPGILENGDRVFRDADQLPGCDLGIEQEETEKPSLDECVCPKPRVSRRDRLLQNRVRPAQVSRALDRTRVRNEVDSQWIVVR